MKLLKPIKFVSWVVIFFVLFFGAGAGFGENLDGNPERQIIAKLASSGWDPEIAEKIAEKILGSNGRVVAVFDHDGTLIQGDLCEGDGNSQPGIIKDLISQNGLKSQAEAAIPPGLKNNIWDGYKKWAERDTKAAYTWLPSLLTGFSDGEAELLARDYYKKVFSGFLFPEMLALIGVLKGAGVEIFVISASPEVFAKAAAPWLGIDPSHIFGIRYKLNESGIIAGVQLPISFAEGKTHYIQKFIGPFALGNLLVFGDSYRTDGHMLRFSARQNGLAVLVNPSRTLIPTLRREGIFSQNFKPIQ